MISNIRNFSIIAHIDHGKSTLADRLIQRCALVDERKFRDQILDSMDIERERGITIKSQAITLPYKARDGKEYFLNLIDTPGHVDFSYEVSRALASCEGALLLVDASQGVQAQTVAHMYAALEQDLVLIPVINKIDLPSADIERVKEEIEVELGLDSNEVLLCSAKEGIGIEEIFEAIIQRIPPPKGDSFAPLRALVFDAQYDQFRGTVVSIRVFDGEISPGVSIRLMSTGTTYKVEEVGIFQLAHIPKVSLGPGSVGYLIAGIKSVRDVNVGDTITLESNPAKEPLPGFKKAKPMVFSSIYPISSEDFQDLAEALEKYRLNDSAIVYQKESSVALGMGFRCGFLGLLHLEVVQERLEREFNQSIIMTLPSVRYRFVLTNGEEVEVDNPAYYPDPARIKKSLEPYVRATIIMPDKYTGPILELLREKRGTDIKFNYPTPGRVEIQVDIPLSEIIYDFYDRLKSITQGYGSFDYEFLEYRESDLVKVDILVNGETVDALGVITNKTRARERALHICERLKEEIPRHLFKIPIQGAIGGTIIARTTINPYRKDVTAKCYGGDITRKRKLLEKQKEGKKRMKMVGSVNIPQSAFVAVFNTQKK